MVSVWYVSRVGCWTYGTVPVSVEREDTLTSLCGIGGGLCGSSQPCWYRGHRCSAFLSRSLPRFEGANRNDAIR